MFVLISKNPKMKIHAVVKAVVLLLQRFDFPNCFYRNINESRRFNFGWREPLFDTLFILKTIPILFIIILEFPLEFIHIQSQMRRID